MPDQTLVITPNILEQLSALRTQPKFHEESEHLYPGAPTEEIRLSAETTVNTTFDRLLVAQALAEPLRLVTHDQTIARYGDTIIFV